MLLSVLRCIPGSIVGRTMRQGVLGFLLIPFLLSLSLIPFSHAETCVLGCRSCKEGFEYTCDKCGDKTCWIMSGGKCNYTDIQCQIPQEPNNELNSFVLPDVPEIQSKTLATE